MGYSAEHRGIALATVGLAGSIIGAVVGGWVTTLAGLGHSLWIFGFLQVFSNAGYWLLASVGAPNLPLMYGATSFELLTSGMGTGAFSVLLLRLTERRFSATQYALFSSLFALPRVLSGPVAGFTVDAIGWGPYYLATMLVGIPGLVMLGRFVPLGVREPDFTSATLVDETAAGPDRAGPHATAGLTAQGVGAGVVSAVGGSFVLALMAVLQSRRGTSGQVVELSTAWRDVWLPGDLGGWLQLLSLLVFGGACGMVAVAAQAARRRRAP
jgi:PAT family beta-lactamase induction signal transducer AmpG